MAEAGEGEMSKSAKRRAAKKARDAAAAEEEAPAPAPAPAPKKAAAPKAEAKAAAAEPAPKSKAKAKAAAEPAAPAAKAAAAPAEPAPKAKGKAKAKAEPQAEAAPEPKAKAKGKAKAEPAPTPEPKAAAKAAAKTEAKPEAKAKPAAKPAAKTAAKSKAKAKTEEEEEEEKPKKKQDEIPFVIDDGSGPAWEEASGLSKKQERSKKMREEKQKYEAQAKAASAAVGVGGKVIPGASFVEPTNTIPGMGPAQASAKAKAKAKSAEAEAAAIAAGILAPKPGAPVEAKEEAASSSVDIKVPEKSIGIVIGPKGKNIKMIQEKTGVTRIDTNDQIFTITGPPDAVMQAKNAIEELITKGYTAIMFEGFKEEKVAAYPASFADIIGSGGKIVRKIKEELNVEVSIPEVPKNVGDKKKYDIKIAGKKEDVDKAVECINSILTYFHHPITHPDQVHEEVEVEQWAYAFIIGKGGSELRHIQNNFKVQVKIPRPPFTTCPNVIIVGEKDNVERAKRSIEKTIWESSNRTGGRGAADKAEDFWGEEGEMEEWEKAYMYKRA